MAAIGNVSSGEMQKGTLPKAIPSAPSVTSVSAPDGIPKIADAANFGTPAIAIVDAGLENSAPETEDAKVDIPPSPVDEKIGESAQPAKRVLVDALAGVDLSAMKLTDGRYRQKTDDGRTVLFTVDPGLQKYTDNLFEQYEVPAGAAVVLNSRTGRVIALTQERRLVDAAPSSAVAFDATPPAASIFKIVTAAALVDKGIPFEKETCYSGGSERINMLHLADVPPKNHACVSMTTALSRSINAVFAKLSDKFLSRAVLQEYAARFGFNRTIDFDVPVKIQNSSAEIPDERLERARTAAGFWHTHLSPLHAASIAQSLAQDGAMLRPYVVEKIMDASGTSLYRAEPRYLRHLVSKETAGRLKRAMVNTTVQGTARKSFHDAAGRPFLPGIDVAGKTGTLTGEKPYRAYTWFVGLAPTEKPEVAVAVLVVNTPKWRIRAPQMAALILKKYFENNKRTRN